MIALFNQNTGLTDKDALTFLGYYIRQMVCLEELLSDSTYYAYFNNTIDPKAVTRIRYFIVCSAAIIDISDNVLVDLNLLFKDCPALTAISRIATALLNQTMPTDIINITHLWSYKLEQSRVIHESHYAKNLPEDPHEQLTILEKEYSTHKVILTKLCNHASRITDLHNSFEQESMFIAAMAQYASWCTLRWLPNRTALLQHFSVPASKTHPYPSDTEALFDGKELCWKKMEAILNTMPDSLSSEMAAKESTTITTTSTTYIPGNYASAVRLAPSSEKSEVNVNPS
jgi:hypothetical protein